MTEQTQRGNSDDSIDDLRRMRHELNERRRRLQYTLYMFVAVGIGMLIAAPLLTSTLSSYKHVPLAVAYGIAPLLMAPLARARLRDVEGDIQEIDFRIDLQQFDVSPSERRAEKVLRIHEFQLRRYYDMNLSHNFWVFSLGVACILLGVGVIAIALYLILHVAATNETKILVAILGGVASILTNFVAMIYLRMNASAAGNLAAFHARLVETHQLLLANLLASRIENDEQRWQTLAQLAQRLGTRSQHDEA